MIHLLILLVVLVIVLSFAVWVIRNFCPAEFQRFAYLILGLIVVICVCYMLLGIGGGNLGSTYRLP